MTKQSEWQEANRRLMAEQREKLGDPPTAEEMLAYSRGELSESEEERIRDLLVAYPDLARMYAAPFPEAEPGDSAVQTNAGFADLQRRLGATAAPAQVRRHYIPTTIAAALALLFFGLFVQAESRARNQSRGCQVPRILGEEQVLDPGPTRGSASPTPLHRDGDVYLLAPQLINQITYDHYVIELNDANGMVWTSDPLGRPPADKFRIAVPHEFLRNGMIYQLRIFGIDGDERRQAGTYNVTVLSE